MSAEYLHEHDAQLQAFPKAGTMFKVLLDGPVDAVLFSSPTPQCFASHAGNGTVKMAGPEFHKMDLGFVVPNDGPIRRKINTAPLTLREYGGFAHIYDRWFGQNW